MQGNLAFGCGQCMPCRLNRRRLWTHRILLETLKHGESGFVTLTYNQKNVPQGNTLVPKDLTDFLKRLRESINPHKIRYYAVGEYGDHTQRPHYHLALFGLGTSATKLIEKTWGLGHVFVGDLTLHSAQYVAGYVTKKMTKKDDPRLNGRYPEFSRMSLRPGIGAGAMKEVADALIGYLPDGDVPMALSHGKKNLPLGRYLRSKLREEMGLEKNVPKEILSQISMQMCELQEDALRDPKNSSKTLKQILIDMNKQKVMNLESRAKIYSKKGGL